MNKISTKKFAEAYEHFIKGTDAQLHHRAVKILLRNVDLEESFAGCIEEGGVKSFLLLWEHAGREEEDPNDREGLRKLGILSKKLYVKGNYQALCELFYDMVFQHTVKFLRLEERADFRKLNDHDLFTQQLLPLEIFLQFFLIGTLIRRTDFDWNRGEVIAHQNLACLIVCWGDIYNFFHEQEEEEEWEKETEARPKVGRNDPCPCGKMKEDGSPLKYKKCHGA